MSTAKQDFLDHTKHLEQGNITKVANKARQTNLVIGIDRPKLKSLAQSTFVNHGNQVVAKLNANTMADLRKHHFNLGYSQYSNKSEYKREFLNQGVSKEGQEKLNKRIEQLRQHNFNLGGKKIGYETSYNQDYFSKSSDARTAKKGIQKQIALLRASRINLGESRENNFINKYSLDFDDKSHFRDKVQVKDNNLRKTNIIMGTNKNDWKT